MQPCFVYCPRKEVVNILKNIYLEIKMEVSYIGFCNPLIFDVHLRLILECRQTQIRR